MLAAPVSGSNDTKLSFMDSGPVPDSGTGKPYTTLVIYHGSAFNGNTFHKLLPLAAVDNVRLVILNRRDYKGSTKYTDEELEELNAGRASFMERLGLEVAYFLSWFARTYNIPQISADRTSGGLVVMGWSLGNATPIALLAYPEVIGKEAYQYLQPYFRQLILYDPPFLAFGYDKPPEGYDPFADPSLPDTQAVFNNFTYWVSEYYDHPGLASRSLNGLDFSKHGNKPTVENMTAEQVELTFEPIAAAKTELPMFFQMQPVLEIQAQKAFFDEKIASEILPDLQVVHMFCNRAPWYCVWGFVETERQFEEYVKQGHKGRPIRFIEIKEANHFVHWDDPEAFWSVTVDAINN